MTYHNPDYYHVIPPDPDKVHKHEFPGDAQRHDEGTLAQCPKCKKWFVVNNSTGYGNSWYPVSWFSWRLRKRIREAGYSYHA